MDDPRPIIKIHAFDDLAERRTFKCVSGRPEPERSDLSHPSSLEPGEGQLSLPGDGASETPVTVAVTPRSAPLLTSTGCVCRARTCRRMGRRGSAGSASTRARDAGRGPREHGSGSSAGRRSKLPMHLSRRCGARTRAGKRCLSPAMQTADAGCTAECRPEPRREIRTPQTWSLHRRSHCTAPSDFGVVARSERPYEGD